MNVFDGEGIDDGSGAVGGGVVANEDLEQVGRIVGGEKVFDPAGDGFFLVVGRDENAKRRQGGAAADGFAAAEEAGDKKEGIAGVHIEDEGQGEPEDEPGRIREH